MKEDKVLPIYTSREELSTRFFDFSNTYFLPIVCVFGLLTSALNIVCSYRNPKSQSLKFIFINSIVDILFLLTQFFVFLFRCGALCSFGNHYFVIVYQIHVFWFLGYTLVNSQVLFAIYVSIDRLRLLTTQKYPTKNSRLFVVYFVCFFISTCLNVMSNTIAYDVVTVGIYKPDNYTREILYGAGFKSHFQKGNYKFIQAVILFISSPTMYLVYCGVNIMVIIKFRKFIKNKSGLIFSSASSKLIF